MRKMGFRACSGFRQGREPCLRAPEGSLDGFRCKQQDRPRREWGFRISIKGTFLSRRKGDIFIEGRQLIYKLVGQLVGQAGNQDRARYCFASGPAFRFRRITTEPFSKLSAIATSNAPSALKSPIAAHTGDAPPGKLASAWNVPSPFPCR